MFKFPVQFNKATSADTIGQRKLIFDIDESIHTGKFNPFEVKRGTQYIMILIELNIEEDREEVEGYKKEETEEETRFRFQKRMHAMLNDYANMIEKKPEEVKKLLRDYLKKEGRMKESTKELSIDGFALGIYWLEKQMESLNKNEN